MTYTQVYIAAVIIIAMLMVILIVHEIGKRAGVKMENKRLKEVSEDNQRILSNNRRHMAEIIKLHEMIESLKNENKELRNKQNVSRGTSSYNQSFGDPEVKMWLDQQYLEGEHK